MPHPPSSYPPENVPKPPRGAFLTQKGFEVVMGHARQIDACGNLRQPRSDIQLALGQQTNHGRRGKRRREKGRSQHVIRRDGVGDVGSITAARPRVEVGSGADPALGTDPSVVVLE